MAGFAETVLVNIDIATGKGAAALNDFKSKIGDAEGGLGKFKAAASGAGDVLSAMPLPAVAGAAVGVGAALVKLGNEFSGAALQAKKMSDATGLTVTSSSEWIAAADDVGLSADTISSAFGKATKAIGLAPAKFEELGVSVVHAKDGTVDMNETLLNAIDTIQATEDPTKKAALASQLFGKSWADLTPLLDKGKESLIQTMGATSDAQRITDQEVESARKWQATIDDLGDTVTDLKMSLGKMVVEGMTPTLEAIAGMLKDFDNLINTLDAGMGGIAAVGEGFALWLQYLSPIGPAMQLVSHALGVLTTAAGLADAALDGFSGFLGGTSVELQNTKGFLTDSTSNFKGHKDATDEAGVSIETLAKEAGGLFVALRGGAVDQEAYAKALKESSDRANDQAAAIDRSTKALQNQQNAALGAIDSELGYRQAVAGVQDGLGTFQTAQADATKAVEEHGAVSDEAVKAAGALQKAGFTLEGSILSTAAAASQYAKDQAEAHGQTFTTNDSINAEVTALEGLKAKFPELGPGIDAHIAKLKNIPTDINTEITAHAVGLDAILDQYNLIKSKTVYVDVKGGVHVGGAASGGFHSGLTMVGEQGPELVNLPAGSYVNTASKTAAMLQASGSAWAGGGGGGNTTVIINMPPGSDGDSVVAALTKWQRRNGPVPISTR